jgi:hypothetical protein
MEATAFIAKQPNKAAGWLWVKPQADHKKTLSNPFIIIL